MIRFFNVANPPFVAELRDVQIFGVGNAFKDGAVMVRGMSSGLYEANVAMQLKPYCDADFNLKIPDCGEVGEAVLLWGDANFGHWIFTYLHRLMVLFSQPSALHLPVMVLDKTPKPFLDWLRLLGFRNYFLAPDGIRVRRLVVPSVVHYRDESKTAKVSPDAVHIFRHLLRRAPGRERIYISRANARWRRIANEDALVEFLDRHAVRRVFMEDMPARAQVALISRCELIVLATGGASPITMLAPESCRIVEIGHPALNGVFGSAAWAHIIGQRYERINARAIGDGANSDLYVDLMEMDKCLNCG